MKMYLVIRSGTTPHGHNETETIFALTDKGAAEDLCQICRNELSKEDSPDKAPKRFTHVSYHIQEVADGLEALRAFLLANAPYSIWRGTHSASK